MAPSFQAPCCGPQSWVMSSMVCPATVGGWLTSSNGSSTVAPSASRYDAALPSMERPTIAWVNTVAGSVVGPPGYDRYERRSPKPRTPAIVPK